MWSDAMEEEFRNTYDKNAYDHEVLAEFGVEEAGVFDKDKVEEATQIDNYAYFDRDKYKPVRSMMDDSNVKEIHILPEGRTTFYPNVFRCMGVDWDKSQAPTSILILEYDQTFNKFRVINRTEIESSEFTFDKAVKKIIDLNAIYNPSYIYIDRGSGKYLPNIL